MPVGIEIISTYGTTQIDGKSPSLALRGKQTVTIPAGSSPIVTFDVANCDIPVFAFRPTDSEKLFGLAQVYPTPGTPTSRRIVLQQIKDNYFDGNPTAAMSIEVYHFDRPDFSAGGNFGFRVYDDLGRCTFNSNIKPALVVGVGYVAAASGRTRALVFAGNFRQTYVHTDSGIRYDEEYVTAANITSTAAAFIDQHLVQYTETSGGSGNFNYVSGVPGGLVLDVTGY